MNKRDLITKRWKPAWSESPAFRRLTTARELVLRIQDQLEATEAGIANDRKAGKLTETGITDKVREVAELAIVPKLRRVQHAVARVRAETAEARAALTVAKPDPTDAAGAIRRMEIRNVLRSSKEMGPVSGRLLDKAAPLDLLQAVFAFPAWVTGIEPGLLQTVEKAIIDREHAGEIAVLEEISEAIAVVEAAATMATSDMAEATGLKGGSGQVLKEWIERASAQTDIEIAREEATAPKVSPDELRRAAEIINRAEKADRDRIQSFIDDRNIAAISGKAAALPDFSQPAKAA
jgi:hypothetical protein